MNGISVNRIWKLMRLELLFHWKYYVMLTIGSFFLLATFFFYVWNKFSAYWDLWDWRDQTFLGYLMAYKILLVFLVYGNAFFDLRSKANSERYLLIPASNWEKLLSQLFIKIGLAEIILPLVFWLSANFASLIWVNFLQEIFHPENLAEFQLIGIGIIWPFPPDQNWAIYLLMLGIYLVLISIFFAGNLYFGKWNLVLTPVSLFIFYLIITSSSVGLSQLLFTKDESILSFNISINEPEIFTDVPLMVLVIIFLLFLGSALSYLVAYYRLKEREV
ncbi:hypothetical protein E4S40_09590 [Algoriphagus kandeliae]|uniref:Uncharacterized protein n=1 Tax=Algoriphagus kandeliae TaxID=2562278 RepID=A0A4Y9QR60_9BACT|nr:hypothetical protein [Algoriphagus kandeliae]TFV94278.1 hypothetical protein E4S40_09590 [Algoriphagus kandeliae]